MKNDLKHRTKIFAHNTVKLVAKLPNDYLSNHIKNKPLSPGHNI